MLFELPLQVALKKKKLQIRYLGCTNQKPTIVELHILQRLRLSLTSNCMAVFFRTQVHTPTPLAGPKCLSSGSVRAYFFARPNLPVGRIAEGVKKHYLS